MVQNLDRTQQTTTDTHRKWPLGAAGPSPSLVCCLLRGLLLFAAVLRVMLRVLAQNHRFLAPRSLMKMAPQSLKSACSVAGFGFRFRFFMPAGAAMGAATCGHACGGRQRTIAPNLQNHFHFKYTSATSKISIGTLYVTPPEGISEKERGAQSQQRSAASRVHGGQRGPRRTPQSPQLGRCC